MKAYPPDPAPSSASATALAPPRLPQFHTVPVRIRADGWTPRRQAEFIGHLAETRSVGEAARRVGMARETAYRLRRRDGAEGFAAAWDAALGKSQALITPRRMVTTRELIWRVETGQWYLGFHRGRFICAVQKADDSALFRLLARLDRAQPRSHAAAGTHAR